MHFVYILYSESIDRFYIGESKDVDARLIKHNADNNQSSTRKGIPWKLKAKFEVPDRNYALKVEKFIKDQKNREFTEALISRGSLKKFPEMTKV